jgi:hypothetical protein
MHNVACVTNLHQTIKRIFGFFILVTLVCKDMWGASYPLFLQNISCLVYVTSGFQDKCLSLWYYFNL